MAAERRLARKPSAWVVCAVIVTTAVPVRTAVSVMARPDIDGATTDGALVPMLIVALSALGPVTATFRVSVAPGSNATDWVGIDRLVRPGTGVVTTIVTLPVRPYPLALIVAVPTPTAVTSPVLVTDATVGADDVQVIGTFGTGTPCAPYATAAVPLDGSSSRYSSRGRARGPLETHGGAAKSSRLTRFTTHLLIAAAGGSPLSWSRKYPLSRKRCRKQLQPNDGEKISQLRA